LEVDKALVHLNSTVAAGFHRNVHIDATSRLFSQSRVAAIVKVELSSPRLLLINSTGTVKEILSHDNATLRIGPLLFFSSVTS
jgi:hypothetical protein